MRHFSTRTNEIPPTNSGQTRRVFLKRRIGAVAIGAGWNLPTGCATAPVAPPPASTDVPWYRRTYRLGQTNITEIDPIRYDIPGFIVNDASHRGRVAFLPADLDRRFSRDNLPDHGNLLAKLVRWTAKDDLPLVVEGPGLVDCHLYRQSGRLILQLVNLTSAGTWRAPTDELIAIGPLRVKIKLPPGISPGKARLLVANEIVRVIARDHWATFEIKSILDHEMISL